MKKTLFKLIMFVILNTLKKKMQINTKVEVEYFNK